MHPDHHHQSTAKLREEARWLGFSSMGPHTEPPNQASKIATLQGTPTRVAKANTTAESPKYQFTFRREQSLELSPAAKKLMTEKREEAGKIRKQMVNSDENPHEVAAALGRRIATPKGKKGRFSDVHMEEFKKMDSIANHPSALRAAASKSKADDTLIRAQTESQKVHQVVASPAKSLKRSPSKAELDEPHHQQQRSLPRMSSKPNLVQHLGSHLPRSTSAKNLFQDGEEEPSSPTKRQKRTATEDVSIARPTSSGFDMAHPATPAKKVHIVSPHISTLASPTEASLARASSVKSKIPGRSLTRSPSKPSIKQVVVESPKPSTPLLARSPSKPSLFAPQSTQKRPTEDKPVANTLLMRSPLKGSLLKKAEQPNEDGSKRTTGVALLSRSPLKASIAKSSDAKGTDEPAAPATPLLARSPAKIVVEGEMIDESSTKIPSKSTGTNLLGRFNLLRASPMKSILRSPQRLFSDDPAKIAAGTHLATPPKPVFEKKKTATPAGAKTAPFEKHVDFTSSTKDRYERAQSELSSTPSKGPTPPPQVDPTMSSPQAEGSLYPSLPSADVIPSVSPQKRRQTAAPGDFTFRAGEHTIIFGQSPNAPPSARGSKSPSTIRHVSAEPQFPAAPVLAPATTAKKRKFEFENHDAADSEMAMETSDKENAAVYETEERPAKRVKQSAPSPSPSPSKPATRRPTLGVKPKKAEGEGKPKNSTMISRARLNALAQPKRRA
jgi:hypothetical protein